MEKNPKIKLTSQGISSNTLFLSAKNTDKRAVIFVPGAGHTAKYFLQSLNHKKGWAKYFSEKGFDCYIFEYPKVTPKNNMIIDSHIILNLLKILVKKINKEIVLITHSLGAFYGWKLAEFYKKISTVIAIAPSPPPNLIDRPKILSQKDNVIEVIFFNQKLTFDFSQPIRFSDKIISSDFVGQSNQFPKKYLGEYKSSLNPIPSLLLKERIIKPPQNLFLNNLDKFKNKQIFIITGEFDIKHSKNEDLKIVSFFKRNGVKKIHHIFLPNAGINGNGHILFAEKNNKKIFDFLFRKIN